MRQKKNQNYKCDVTLMQCMSWNTKGTDLFDYLLLNVFLIEN